QWNLDKDNLIRICVPFFKESTLVFPDASTALRIEAMAEKLLLDAQRLSLSPEELEKVEATYEEIRMASAKLRVQTETVLPESFDDRLPLPPAFLSTLAQALEKGGIPLSNLGSYKDMLIHAFGEDLRAPLEALIEKASSLPATSTSTPSAPLSSAPEKTDLQT